MTLHDSYSRDFWRLFHDDIRSAAVKIRSLESSGRFDSLDNAAREACSIVEDAGGMMLTGNYAALLDALETVQTI